MEKKLLEACIRLFNVLPVYNVSSRKAPSKILFKESVSRGVIFAPNVVANFREIDLLNLLKSLFVTGKQLNNTFHKSWKKIREANYEDLVVEQLAHYLSTYGKQNPEEYVQEKGVMWGVYDLGAKILGLTDFDSRVLHEDETYIYIPKEDLEVPDLELEGLRLRVIQGISREQLKERLLELLHSGIALNHYTLNDCLVVGKYVGINEFDLDLIRNREAKVRFCKELNLVPLKPEEFLRYVIFSLTSNSVLVKSNDVMLELKGCLSLSEKKKDLIENFKKYLKVKDKKDLATIFYRFKPIFLAFKKVRSLRPTINKIRKLAYKYHRPTSPQLLDNVTALIKNGKTIDKKELIRALKKVNVFRIVRLINSLSFYSVECDSIVYRIRNGKYFVKDREFSNQSQQYKRIRKICLEHLVSRLNLKGKKVYLPEDIELVVPSSEKNFCGNLPEGSYLTVPDRIILGVHWYNINHKQTDLDLSLIDKTKKIGWDGAYRNNERTVLFSGDVTNAPKPRGASECYYISWTPDVLYSVFLNIYSVGLDESWNQKVPYTFYIAKTSTVPKTFKRNYMVDPNKIVFSIPTVIDSRTAVIGTILAEKNKKLVFVFGGAGLGYSRSMRNKELVGKLNEYILAEYKTRLTLRELLEVSGAKIAKKREDDVVDLSTNLLSKDSIINLLKEKGV